jgi:gas vesicle protein
METYVQEEVSNGKNIVNLMIGLLVGGMAGAAAMLLFVPQSGKATRNQIQQKAIELRDQTNSSVEEAILQIRTSVDQLKSDISDRANELRHQGEEVLVEQLDRVSSAVESGKKAVKNQQS